MKVYYQEFNIGKAKYIVNHHDGEKLHTDGSLFYDIAVFSNKKAKDKFIQTLKKQGYSER